MKIQNQPSFSGRFRAPKGSLAKIVKGDKNAHKALKDIVHHVKNNTPVDTLITCTVIPREFNREIIIGKKGSCLMFSTSQNYLKEAGSPHVKDAIDRL